MRMGGVYKLLQVIPAILYNISKAAAEPSVQVPCSPPARERQWSCAHVQQHPATSGSAIRRSLSRHDESFTFARPKGGFFCGHAIPGSAETEEERWSELMGKAPDDRVAPPGFRAAGGFRTKPNRLRLALRHPARPTFGRFHRHTSG